jgi:hypothetical protein
MEKIKIDYLKFWLMTLVISAFILSIGVGLKINEFSQAPVLILATFGIILYVYILDEFTESGYRISTDGIYINKKLTSGDQVSNNKDTPVWKILLQDINTNIHFDQLHQKSILKLIKKYCPQNHILYKTLEEYAQKKDLPF